MERQHEQADDQADNSADCRRVVVVWIRVKRHDTEESDQKNNCCVNSQCLIGWTGTAGVKVGEQVGVSEDEGDNCACHEDE